MLYSVSIVTLFNEAVSLNYRHNQITVSNILKIYFAKAASTGMFIPWARSKSMPKLLNLTSNYRNAVNHDNEVSNAPWLS